VRVAPDLAMYWVAEVLPHMGVADANPELLDHANKCFYAVKY